MNWLGIGMFLLVVVFPSVVWTLAFYRAITGKFPWDKY